jgi:polysaccharide export outer membrane protein
LLVSVILGSANVNAADKYLIGPGDLLDINIWKDDSLSRVVTVLPDGSISFPLIGEVEAADKTVSQLKQELEKKISRFVPDPVLSLIVQQVNSLQIYVVGRVNNPGRFMLNTNVNVLQALTIAGGLNPFAKRSKVKIMRKKDGQTTIYNFDFDEVAKGENLEQNITLRRGDVIVAP